MCGIAGIAHFNFSHKVILKDLKDMTDTIFHRGPDDEGHLVDNNIGLGFRRLSIIDLSLGHQPMSDSLKKVWIVFNGEIYNYHILRSDLTNLGYRFSTNSDTEVIVNCYLEYGEKCLEKLRGMFAFVVWDKEKNKLFIARDRFGIKPLYYLLDSNGIVFASELKAVYRTNYSKKEIDIKAVDSFFTYGYILSPLTIYKDIKKLPAGHSLSIDLDNPTKTYSPKRYWHPTFSIDYNTSFEDYQYQIREKLRESTKAHLVSDVPVGAFLSGGVDSNSVVSMMSSEYEGKLKTFTIGFEDNKYDESRIAKLTSEKYKSEHHELIINKESALNLEKIISLYDEPFGDSSAIPTYFVSKLAAQHVKVVLSGDGGDEFFGGYDSYRRLLKMSRINLPQSVKYPIFRSLSKILPGNLPGKRFSYTLAQKKMHQYAYFGHMWYDEKSDFFIPEVLRQIRNDPIHRLKTGYLDDSVSNDYLSKMMELDILTYMPDDILTKVDRASMANSLEVRVPIIDHEFFELAMKIPSNHKVKPEKGKYIFREAMRDYLPQEVYNLPKQGFKIPITEWFKDDLNDFVHDNLNSDNSITDFVQRSYLEKLQHTNKLGSKITRIWPIIVFNYWLNNLHSE